MAHQVKRLEFAEINSAGVSQGFFCFFFFFLLGGSFFCPGIKRLVGHELGGTAKSIGKVWQINWEGLANQLGRTWRNQFRRLGEILHR